MNNEFRTTYNSSEFEHEILDNWKEAKSFYANANSEKEAFCIVMPPPNVTGRLHMGHALDMTLQDILTRFKRMQGFEALWLPGSDHAAIATEAKIVEKLKKEGRSKTDLGREAFLEHAWSWKNEFEAAIFKQIEKLGASCDLSRKRFTMDSGFEQAVNEFFVKLFEEGLIYRGERIINWCFKCNTSISDVEVEHVQQSGHLWHLKYFFANDPTKFVEVATTRPETLFGDVAVAVNPADARYNNLIGAELVVPIVGRTVPIIADDYVDMKFGTGAVKITPAHDFNDFEVGLRHGLKQIRVVDFEGKLNENAGSFAGVSLGKAREMVVEALKNNGLIEKVVDHVHNVGCCYRCGKLVEPMVSKQWFVKMKQLAQPAIEAVESGAIEFCPGHFAKTYLNWLYSVKDWCISRQLWWGHQIPAWHCSSCGEVLVAKVEPKVCTKCGSGSLKRDPDVLDTWFSSALWPQATLGWPNEEAADFKKFYPTDVLVTGYDIIFFWVVRMAFSALKTTNKVPFKKVLIHGIVRDSQGRKMSKSLGNGIDPLEIIDEVGADALRFFLASNINAGSDIRFSKEKLMASRNFVNKIWNASRFIFLNLEKFGVDEFNRVPKELELEDKWLLSKLNELIKQLTQNIESFEISVASQKLYDFVWDIYCSWFLELSKIRLAGDEGSAKRVLCILTYCLDKILKLLHPFMPFISEKINLLMFGKRSNLLAVAKWPEFQQQLFFAEGLEFEKIMAAIREIRNIRAQMGFGKNKKIKIFIETKFVDLFKKSVNFFHVLVGASEVAIEQQFQSNSFEGKNFVKVATGSARIFIDFSGTVDLNQEKNRLLKEEAACAKEVEFYKSKLSNDEFLKKAPAHVLEKQRAKLNAAIEKLEKTKKSLAELHCSE